MTAPSTIRKVTVVIAGRPTSVSLETEFHAELKRMAQERKTTIQDVIAGIEAKRTRANLSSEVRVAVLRHLRAKAFKPEAANA